MYGKNNESGFVHSSMETGNLISMKKISLEWERYGNRKSYIYEKNKPRMGT